MHASPHSVHPAVREALELLGIRNFLLGIHDPAFPSLPEEDIGRGSPYSEGAAEFLGFAKSLGFDGIQLGPQGITTPTNPSPYDGTIFSKNPLSLGPLWLTRPERMLLRPGALAGIVDSRPDPPDRVHREFAGKAMETIVSEVCRERGNVRAVGWYEPYADFRRRNAAWLERDAMYGILRRQYGGTNWKHWGEDDKARLDRRLWFPPPGAAAAAGKRRQELLARHAEEIEDYCFIQYLLGEQHRRMRESTVGLGLKLFGDLQIGLSGRDAWHAQSFLLPDYVMGAPPSRTNPEGQPWNYPVLDPRSYLAAGGKGFGGLGPAPRFLRERIDKLFSEFDGIRVDHPHGLVCPWVYRAGQPDPILAVQAGARLFASPDLPDHPELAEFAIPRPDQINRKVKRHADDWVATLEPGQVERYGMLLTAIVESARDSGKGVHEIACEILSTQPYPIRRVMELHGLGRFRITQKADLANPLDVYRGENARPEDWIMMGNHDTPPIWRVAEEWLASGESRRQADYLAMRLRIPEEEREGWTRRAAADAGELAQAKFADLLVGPARNVMVFFTDLLGMRQTYNRPGTVNDDNWTLRVPPGYRGDYASNAVRSRALNIPKALALALRSRGRDFTAGHRPLLEELDALAGLV